MAKKKRRRPQGNPARIAALERDRRDRRQEKVISLKEASERRAIATAAVANGPRPQLQVIEGGAPLEDRPEYQAHMCGGRLGVRGRRAGELELKLSKRCFVWANRHGFGFRFWAVELQLYLYGPSEWGDR